jgi:hypothetical protein
VEQTLSDCLAGNAAAVTGMNCEKGIGTKTKILLSKISLLQSIFQSVFVFVCLPVYLSLCVSDCMFVCVSVCVSVCLSVCLPSICLHHTVETFAAVTRRPHVCLKTARWNSKFSGVCVLIKELLV